MQKKGISVIICCYNSDWIIDRCLNALEQQIISKSIPWEVIIVNNLSTDNTEKVVKEFISKNPYRYHIVYEQKPGLLYARIRGVQNAQYSYIIFCDDDNILSPHYLEGMFNLMEQDNRIGAYGGCGIAEYLAQPHPLVIDFAKSYALGSQKQNINFLYGAGLCIRYDIISKLYSSNNTFMLTGRCGNSLLAGDDSEIIKQVLLQGYCIKSTDDLTFLHVLPAKRLTLSYLLKIQYGFGLSYPILNTYDLAIQHKSVFFIYLNIIKNFLKLIKYYFSFHNPKRIDRLHYSKGVIKGYSFWGIHKITLLLKNLKKHSEIK